LLECRARPEVQVEQRHGGRGLRVDERSAPRRAAIKGRASTPSARTTGAAALRTISNCGASSRSRGRQRDPQLQNARSPHGLDRLAVDDAATGRHPNQVPGQEGAFIAIMKGSLEHERPPSRGRRAGARRRSAGAWATSRRSSMRRTKGSLAAQSGSGVSTSTAVWPSPMNPGAGRRRRVDAPRADGPRVGESTPALAVGLLLSI